MVILVALVTSGVLDALTLLLTHVPFYVLTALPATLDKPHLLQTFSLQAILGVLSYILVLYPSYIRCPIQPSSPP